jgi:hypothetical protein
MGLFSLCIRSKLCQFSYLVGKFKKIVEKKDIFFVTPHKEASMPTSREKEVRYPNNPRIQREGGLGSRQARGAGIVPGQYNPVMEKPALNMHGVQQAGSAGDALAGKPDRLGQWMNKGLNRIQPGQQMGPPVPAHHTSPEALLMDGSMGGRPVGGGQAAWATPFALPGPQPASQPGMNVARESLASNPPMPAPMIGTDSNQINTTRNTDGSTTYQTGIRGQDGFGWAKTSPNFREDLAARQQLAGQPQQQQMPQQRPQQSQGGGMPQLPTGGQGQRRSRGEAPRPMTLEERKAAGIGWKTAREHLSNAWRDYTSEGGNISAEGISAGRNAASLGERQMAEAGANQRAGEALAAGGDGRALDNESKRMQNQQSQMEMSVREQLANSEQGSPEYQQAMARLKALRTSGEPEKLNTQMVDVPIDPSNPMAGTIKVPAVLNQEGRTYTLMQQTGGQEPIETILDNDEKAIEALRAMKPDQRALAEQQIRLRHQQSMGR